MNQKNILIIDDEPDILELLSISIHRMGHSSVKASSKQQALEKLNLNQFSLCLTDMNLGDGNGLEIIQHIQDHYPDLPVAMITAYNNIETAITALKAGAFDYVAKPIDLPKLKTLINSALHLDRHSNEDIQTTQSIQLLGESQVMQQLRTTIGKLSRSLAPVFINGESGSGKELVARMIHQLGSRASQPFIAINCGAIPSELMESEFFGHEKGSFTGASEKKMGLFQSAKGGTLFLDEVADLPQAMQVKLLRAIQEKSIRSIGSTQEVNIDVRILSATHKNLTKEVAERRFREDLFYRINVIELQVPSLKARPDDILLLAEHILKKLALRYETDSIQLSKSAKQKLEHYHFPGNVRELENILERAFTLSDSNCINDDDIAINDRQPSSAISHNNAGDILNIHQAIGNMDGFLEDVEKQILELALEQTRWNKTAAAELLGISFRTIRYKCKKLNID